MFTADSWLWQLSHCALLLAVSLFPSGGLELQDDVHSIFQDSTGKHLIYCTRNGQETFYHNLNMKKAHLVAKSRVGTYVHTHTHTPHTHTHTHHTDSTTHIHTDNTHTHSTQHTHTQTTHIKRTRHTHTHTHTDNTHTTCTHIHTTQSDNTQTHTPHAHATHTHTHHTSTPHTCHTHTHHTHHTGNTHTPSSGTGCSIKLLKPQLILPCRTACGCVDPDTATPIHSTCMG